MLSSSLDEYRALLATLPLVPLPEANASWDGDVARRVRSYGDRVTERLEPGLDISAIASTFGPLEHPVPDEVIEWFEWSNGHRGGIYDSEDDLACFLPYGRHLNIEEATSESRSLAEFLVDAPGPVEHAIVLSSIAGDLLTVDCATGEVWALPSESDWERLFPTVADMVDHCSRLVQGGWITLTLAGSVRMLNEHELAQRGYRFRSDLDQFGYEALCRLPSDFPAAL